MSGERHCPGHRPHLFQQWALSLKAFSSSSFEERGHGWGAGWVPLEQDRAVQEEKDFLVIPYYLEQIHS